MLMHGGYCVLDHTLLHFHPSADVAEPKITALTWFYKFYYDCILSSRFSVQIIGLHNRYMYSEYAMTVSSVDRCLVGDALTSYCTPEPHRF